MKKVSSAAWGVTLSESGKHSLDFGDLTGAVWRIWWGQEQYGGSWSVIPSLESRNFSPHFWEVWLLREEGWNCDSGEGWVKLKASLFFLVCLRSDIFRKYSILVLKTERVWRSVREGRWPCSEVSEPTPGLSGLGSEGGMCLPLEQGVWKMSEQECV